MPISFCLWINDQISLRIKLSNGTQKNGILTRTAGARFATTLFVLPKSLSTRRCCCWTALARGSTAWAIGFELKLFSEWLVKLVAYNEKKEKSVERNKRSKLREKKGFPGIEVLGVRYYLQIYISIVNMYGWLGSNLHEQDIRPFLVIKGKLEI